MQTASNLAIRGIRAGPLPKQLQQPNNYNSRQLSFYFTLATVLATSSVRQVGHWAQCQGRLAGSPLLGGTQMQSPLLGGTLVESPVLLAAGRGRLVRSPVLQVPVRDLRGKETTTADLPVSSLKTSHLASQPLEVAKKKHPTCPTFLTVCFPTTANLAGLARQQQQQQCRKKKRMNLKTTRCNMSR